MIARGQCVVQTGPTQRLAPMRMSAILKVVLFQYSAKALCCIGRTTGIRRIPIVWPATFSEKEDLCLFRYGTLDLLKPN